MVEYSNGVHRNIIYKEAGMLPTWNHKLRAGRRGCSWSSLALSEAAVLDAESSSCLW